MQCCTSDTTDSKAEDSSQDDGTVGNGQTYGYDSSYQNDRSLSDGNSYFVKGQGKNKTVVSFSFTGTGFDLISRTGEKQGLIQAIVYSDAAKTTAVKNISVLNKSDSQLELYQIPVLSVELESYGTYYVDIHVYAAYTATSDTLASLNRGGEFYFDAIRIYNPVQGNSVAEAAYATDDEYNPQVSEVRNLLLDADTFDAIESGSSEKGMVFIDRTQDGAVISTYATIGPNNEVYLENGQAVAFKITANSVPASIDVGAKSIKGGDAQLSAVVTDTATTNYSVVKDITSSTAQNINLMNDTTTTAIADASAYVIITNTGTDTDVLSITDIKVAYDGTSAAVGVSENYDIDLTSLDEDVVEISDTENETENNDVYAVTYTVDAATFSLARTVLTTSEDTEEEESEETEAEANYDILSASVNISGNNKNRTTVITVKTTQDVVELKIMEGHKNVKYSSMEYEDQEDGTRVWTVVLAKSSNGNKTYTITGNGEDGTSGASATVSTKGNKR